jgi:hypothetical protein
MCVTALVQGRGTFFTMSKRSTEFFGSAVAFFYERDASFLELPENRDVRERAAERVGSCLSRVNTGINGF